MLKEVRDLLSTTASLAIVAAVFVTAPFDIRLDGETAVVSLQSSVAWARDGDRDDDDNDDDDDDDDDRSGKSGGGRDDDDRKDERDDDNSGRGNARDDRSDRDDDDNDDDSGRGRGRSGSNDDRSGTSTEVTFSDGSRIEIENGRFERKDASGRTIEERPATRSDIAKLQQAGTASGGSSNSVVGYDRDAGNGKFRGGGVVAKAEALGGHVEVTYTDGWKEEIENGRYELKDPQNRTVVQRRARQSDVSRLSKAFR